MPNNNKLSYIAVIREEECIGCAKCLPVCPVDAIIGAPRMLHTVVADMCIGCKLCIAPCPMDCIDLVAEPLADLSIRKQRADLTKQRYLIHKKRLEKNLPLIPSAEARKSEIANILKRRSS